MKTQKTNFPQPVYFGNRRHWALSALLTYEAILFDRPAPPPMPPEEERYLTASQVKARYGDKTDVWLHRMTGPAPDKHSRYGLAAKRAGAAA